MSPRVTVETLAALVEQGFEHQEKQHDRMYQRLDRFEEQVLTALEQRPTRDEVHVIVKAATKNGNGKVHWWDAWGRIAATLLALAGALGAGIAAAMQSGG